MESEFVDWMVDTKGVSRLTANCYERTVRGIWPNDPSGWVLRKLRNRPPGTASVVKAATRRWIEYTGRKPANYNLRGGRARAHRKAPRALSSSQLRAYYAGARKAQEPVRTILLLLPRTGMRISELCGARKSQLERREGRVALVFTGKREYERRVYLSEPAEGVLDDYLREATPKGPFLFPGYKGLSLSPSRVRQVSLDLGSGLGFRVNPHTLRHTYATRLHAEGVPLAVIQESLGHASERTTLQYIHPTDKELIKAADSVERGLYG